MDIEEKNEEEILERRKRLKENPELQDVFSMFWMVLSIESPDGDVIYKNHFSHFLYLLQSAFLGPGNVSEKEALEVGEQEFIHNVGYYGEFCQFAFYDIMAECVECWSDTDNKRFHPAFAWTLFTSIVNIDNSIPCFLEQNRIKRIRCGPEYESGITTSYFADKPTRLKMLKLVKWAQDNAHLDPATKKRMQTRRRGMTVGVEDSRQLFDLFTIHKHRLDREAAERVAKSKGRIDPSIKSKAQLHRTISLVRSQSMASVASTEFGSNDSDDDDSDGVSAVSRKDIFATPSPKKRGDKGSPQQGQMNVFKRSMSNLAQLDTSHTDSPMTDQSSSPHFYDMPKNRFDDAEWDEAINKVKEQPDLSTYSNIDHNRKRASPLVKNAPILRLPEKKKREILVKENSNLARKLRLDPTGLEEEEREAFFIKHGVYPSSSPTNTQAAPFSCDDYNEESSTKGGKSPSSLFSKQYSPAGPLSRQSPSSSRRRRLSKGGFSRQSSGVSPTNNSPGTSSRQQANARGPISRGNSGITSIRFNDEDDSNYVDFDAVKQKLESGFGEDRRGKISRTNSSVGPQTGPKQEGKVLQVRKRPFRSSEGDENEVTGMEELLPENEPSGHNSLEYALRDDPIAGAKHHQPVRVENVIPSYHGGGDSQDMQNDDTLAQSYENIQIPSSNISVDSIQRSHSASPTSAKKNDDSIDDDEMSNITNQFERNANLTSNPMESYDNNGCQKNDEGDNEDGDTCGDSASRQHSLDDSAGASQSEFGFVTGDISTGPSLNPGSLSKYSHHLSRENSFMNADSYDEDMDDFHMASKLESYVAELPENISALPPRVKQKNKVCVAVDITPKMIIAKDVIEKKQSKRKVLQDKKFLKETRKATAHLKRRGQTPMQRIVAAQFTIPDAPGKYAVPADVDNSEKENPNIEYLMKLVSKNKLYKKEMRKKMLGTISVDVSVKPTIEQHNEPVHAITDPPLSPETNGSVFSLTSQEELVTAGYDREEDEKKTTAKVLDLFNMKKGLIRSSYLNLRNQNELPEYIYISKQGKNSFAERLSSGRAYVTEWDRFLILFVKILDSHIEKVIKKTDKLTLKELMSQLLNLSTACSKEQKFRQLCTEFDVINIGDQIDELHILGEIYRKREKLITKVMSDTAEILQKKIDSNKKYMVSVADAPPPPTMESEDNEKFPSITIDDSQTIGTSQTSPGSMSTRKVLKSRTKWVKKLCKTAQPITFGSSVASSVFSHHEEDGNSLADGASGKRSQRRVRVASVDGSIGSLENGSQLSDGSSYVMKSSPIVDGSVSFSCNQSVAMESIASAAPLHSHSRSRSATSRRIGRKSSVPHMPPPRAQEGSVSDSSLLKTKGLFTNSSTISRPHTALNTLSFYKESVPDMNDSIYHHNDAPYVPWIPQGGMKMMVSDKTDVLNGWRERRDVGDYVESTRSSAILRRSGVIKNSFESFSRLNTNYLSSQSVDKIDFNP